jgi:hypothetical protein
VGHASWRNWSPVTSAGCGPCQRAAGLKFDTGASQFLLYAVSATKSAATWESGTLGSIEVRAASSAAHIYGMRQVFAEAFTGGPFFTSTPWSLNAATAGVPGHQPIVLRVASTSRGKTAGPA